MKGREPSAQLQRSRWWTDQASREEMESGVVVFDKRRTDVVYGLLYTGWLNTKLIREAVTYENTYGASCSSPALLSLLVLIAHGVSQATKSPSGWCAPPFPPLVPR